MKNLRAAAAAPSVKIELRCREELGERQKVNEAKEKKNLQEVERLGSVFLLFFAHVARVEMSFG